MNKDEIILADSFLIAACYLITNFLK